MALVLFPFIIMTLAETLEEELIKNGLYQLQSRQHNNFPLSKRCVSIQRKQSFSEGILFEFFCMLQVICLMVEILLSPLKRTRIGIYHHSTTI